MKLRTKATFDNAITEREKLHREIAYKAAIESMVLLKNEGILPTNPENLALYGIGAAINLKGGTGSGEVNERHTISIKEGLENVGFTITTNKWLEEYKKVYNEGKKAYGKDLMKKSLFGSDDDRINIMANPYHYPFGRKLRDEDLKASKAKTCIYVIGRQAGECHDRSLEHYDFNLAPEEIHNIEKAAYYYEKLIVVINVGGSMDLTEIENIKGVDAIIFMCQLGMEGGRALADIITGKATPSACLTDTWALKYNDIPFADEYSYINGNLLEEDYKEGIYVGYRYFNTFEKPVRYEFGFGLSYTEFDMNFLSLVHDKSKVFVKVDVRNIGNQYSGKKVVQLYISCPDGLVEKEYQSLAAFGKTRTLKPGESQVLTLEFDLAQLASYYEKTSEFILDKGDYILRLGESSKETQVCGLIRLAEKVVVEKCNPICPLQKKIHLLEKELKKRESNVSETVTRLRIDPSSFSKVVHNYEEKNEEVDKKVEELFSSLKEKERLQLVMGAGVLGAKPMQTVSGSAAYTASFPEKKIANMIFCDGPAGLRVQRTSVLMKNGSLKPVEPMMEFMELFPSIMKKLMFGNPEKGKLMFQYATAFPVGTALAQTWNMELLKEIGDAVGTEMEEYGVTFWLAPGMNLHRNPLCGRNYEYFSEDPLLTGKCAAAITRGVQSHEGCFVTLKHYAANNQETNRSRVSSNMNERTLRELYLKAFKIAVTEGNAKGVMTSYNKINGKYTSTDKDLNTKALRNEWGFDGLVMTDWFGTGTDLASNGETIHAGVDLLMPGGGKYIKALKKD